MSIEDILEEFDGLEDWDERCDYLIDLGFDLPEFPEDHKTEPNRVHGCQSNVWMVLAQRERDGREVVEIAADSDAMIVRGLIAVLLALYSGKTAAEIVAVDARKVFSRLGLDRHLSPARRNGLSGMVKRIREFARSASA
ncbi:MAG: SufE family protein [Planctomycetaceae bacterium]